MREVMADWVETPVGREAEVSMAAELLEEDWEEAVGAHGKCGGWGLPDIETFLCLLPVGKRGTYQLGNY